MRDASRNDVLARVKADDYGGYIVVRANGHYKAGETEQTRVGGKSWSEIVSLLKNSH
ncbi:hypothetical protein [Tessaracoccus defluvii]|uniref:hypothetical protein n=1 Tax=Tessaracoccus defluvii TaxID=1285901 RepID=UPI001D049354|nr:hypothetical protein [Tessaracoccus defluvii]